MADSTLNRFLASGTTAQRTAFVPSPPTPASGPAPGYVWFDTTLQQEFAWNGSAWVSTGTPGAAIITGTPAAGNLTEFASGTSITNGNLSGDVTTAGALTTTLAASGVTAGTYGDSTHVPQVAVDAKGRVTAASNVALAAAGMTQLTGDVTAGPGSGSQAATLATSGASAGTYGDATHVPVVTVDAKGRITAVSSVAVTTTGAGGSFVLLEQHTASASASLNFTTFISASYDTYVFEFVGIVPTVAGDSFLAVVGTGGGPTWDTGSNYRYADYSSDQSTASGAAGSGASTTSIHLYDNLGGTAAQGGLNGTMSVYDPANSTASKVLIFLGSGESAASNLRQYTGSGRYIPTTALTGVQFSMSTGTVASGTIRCYGVQKTAGGGGGGSGNVISATAVGSEPVSPASGDTDLYTNSFGAARYSGSVWQPWGPLFPLTDPRVTAPTTWVNQGTASVSSSHGGIVLSAPAAGGVNWRLQVGTAPATPYTITGIFLADPLLVNNHQFGLCFRQSSSGLQHCLSLQANSGVVAGTWSLSSIKYTTATAFSAVYGTQVPYANSPLVFLRIADDGTSRICSYSGNGQDWLVFTTIGRTDFLTADQVGFGVDVEHATYGMVVTLLSWKVN
jgi:hypothetical protein